MERIIYRANSRGKFQNEWLNTHYSFSFADYFDRNRMNFGALRVLNDDIIQAGQGFGKHPHDNMEIITIPLSGILSHKDSMGHQKELGINEVQAMSAGSGIFHSEFNSSLSDEVALLQLWIYPKTKNIEPAYNQLFFQPDGALGKWQKLVSGDYSSKNVLHINQDATISRVFLPKGQELSYQLAEGSFGSFVFLVEGEIIVDGEKLGKRDAIGISGAKEFLVMAAGDSYLINIELPER